MTKRILSVVLTVVMVMSLMTFTVSAEDIEYMVDERLPELTYTITNVTQSGYIEDNPEYGMEVTITTDSVITFDFPLDWLDVWYAEKEESVFLPDFHGEKDAANSYEVTVDCKKNVRIDNVNVDELTKGNDEISYYEAGTTIKFNSPGCYSIIGDVGFNNADERIAFYSGMSDEVYNMTSKSGHIAFEFIVYVEMGEGALSDDGFGDFTDGEAEFAPQISDENAYDKSLVSIEGIKDIYHISEYNVGQEEYVAYCTAPLTITANTNLDDFALYPMYYINEGQLWDEKLPLCPDGKTLQDYDWYESHQEIYAKEPDIDLAEYVYANAGEKYTITKPGFYQLYATIYDEAGNYENDIRTQIVLKITDLNAKYTDSKVLVDGEEYKFEAYNIEDNNYFKLRDIAMMLNKNDNMNQYINVLWDAEKEVVNIKRGEKYQAVGGEFAEGDGMSKIAEYGATELYIDGYPTPVRAYMINGNNYFKLRDLAQVFGTFEVGWDEAANSVIIDTLSVLNQ